MVEGIAIKLFLQPELIASDESCWIYTPMKINRRH